MTRIPKLFVVSFVAALFLSISGCATNEEKPLELTSEQQRSIDLIDDSLNATSLDVSSECECGNFIDDDMDGVCDLAVTGECRKARTDRCPCGHACTGC